MFNILLERNLQGVGAGCPYMLEDKLWGKKTNLAKDRAFDGIQGNKVCHPAPLEDGVDNSERACH